MFTSRKDTLKSIPYKIYSTTLKKTFLLSTILNIFSILLKFNILFLCSRFKEKKWSLSYIFPIEYKNQLLLVKISFTLLVLWILNCISCTTDDPDWAQVLEEPIIEISGLLRLHFGRHVAVWLRCANHHDWARSKSKQQAPVQTGKYSYSWSWSCVPFFLFFSSSSSGFVSFPLLESFALFPWPSGRTWTPLSSIFT